MLVANRTPLGDSHLPLYLLSPSASLAEDRLEGLQITLTVVIVLDRKNNLQVSQCLSENTLKTLCDFERALTEGTTPPS